MFLAKRSYKKRGQTDESDEDVGTSYTQNIWILYGYYMDILNRLRAFSINIHTYLITMHEKLQNCQNRDIQNNISYEPWERYVDVEYKEKIY